MRLFILILLFSAGLHAQIMESVYFKHASHQLDKNAEKKLDSLAQLKSKLRFRIIGNCDSSGSEGYNKTLSENRAAVVAKYLEKRIGSNIKLEDIVGLGKQKQINNNSTEELRSKNRRVDILIDRAFSQGERIYGKVSPSFFNVRIQDMKVKDTFSLPNVSFIGNRHVWLPKGNETLFRLLKILKENPSLYVELQGHICCDYDNFDGEDIDLGTFNLSWTRANAIKEFLQSHGIDTDRIKASGQGHLNPVIYPERTENDRIKNRRVEIVILAK